MVAGLVVAGALGLVGICALPSLMVADGGTLRVANVPMGEYRVSVYTAPTPIPPDSIDVSVLATFQRGREVAPDLKIWVVAVRTDSAGPRIRHPATREQADDPRYYAAKFTPGFVGEWEIQVQLQGPRGEGEVRFQVRVQEPGPLSNPFIILTAALLPLLLVGWWLRSGKAAPNGKDQGVLKTRPREGQDPSRDEVNPPSSRPGAG